MPTDDSHALLDAACDALSLFGTDPEAAIRALDPIYADEMRFQDPLQTLHGKAEFIAMNHRLVKRSRVMTFDVISRAATTSELFITWHFRMETRVGPVIAADGVSHLRIENGLITDHRDYWDLLGAFADAFPLVGPIYKAVIAKLG